MEISVQGLSSEGTRVIEVGNKKHYSSFSTFFAMVVVLVVPIALAYSGGYFFGKYQAINNQQAAVRNFKPKPSASGQSLYVDKENLYQISYPEGWGATKKAKTTPGAVLESHDSSVELWLGVDHPVTLGAEQKAAVAKTTKVDFKIGKAVAKMTEYTYQAGNYFSIIELAPKGNSPSVTFWVKALDEKSYTTAKEVVQTFSF